MKVEKNLDKSDDKSAALRIFKFTEAYVPPVYSFVKKGEYHFLSFGADNLYPMFLIGLYNNYGSPLHKSIINKKVKLCVGFGYKELTDPRMIEWARKNNLERLLQYISKDFEIFNAWACEVIWSRDGSTFDLQYLPIHTLRIGLKEEEDEPDFYWYSKDWANIKKEENKPEYIKKFDPNDRTGRQVIYYIDPNPAMTNLYGIPSYSTAINYISLDYEIGKFHINQVKQGYSPSFILSFNTSVPTQDEQNLFYREFQRNYKGADNSGKIIVTWAEGKEQAPELIPIQLNDSDERFIMLQDMVEKNITQCHEMPPQLISFQPGKLGSSDERKEMMSEFQTYYTAIRQNQIEEGLNGILETIGFKEKIVLKNYISADESNLLSDNNTEEPISEADSQVDNSKDDAINLN
jgi:hypothetical protein